MACILSNVNELVLLYFCMPYVALLATQGEFGIITKLSTQSFPNTALKISPKSF